MTTNIVTPQTVKHASAVCTAAKTTYGDAANAVALFTAGASGAVLYKLTAMPRATVTATELQLYRYDGATYFYVAAVAMAAHTKAQTTAPTATDFGFTESAPLRLKAGDQLLVAAGVALAGGIVFTAQYEDL